MPTWKKLIITFVFSLCVPFLFSDEYSLKLIKEFPLPSVREPSGLCFADDRNSLFVVGDEGHITEFNTEGFILNKSWLGNRDLEGVAYNNSTGALYVLDERINSVLILDTETFQILDEAFLPKEINGPFEGLALDKEGTLLLVNQLRGKKKQKAMVVLLNSEGDIQTMKTGIEDQSSVTSSGDYLYILSDTSDRLYCFSMDGKQLWDTKVPGRNQEGVAIDKEGYIYIAQDSGGIMKFELIFGEAASE